MGRTSRRGRPSKLSAEAGRICVYLRRLRVVDMVEGLPLAAPKPLAKAACRAEAVGEGGGEALL